MVILAMEEEFIISEVKCELRSFFNGCRVLTSTENPHPFAPGLMTSHGEVACAMSTFESSAQWRMS